MHFEHDVPLLDAGLDQLTSIVEVKPFLKLELPAVIAVNNQRTVLQSGGRVETLQSEG